MFKKIIVFVAIIFGVYYIYICNDVKYIQSDIDHKKYVVLNKKDSKDAANLLATMSKNLISVKTHLEQNYNSDDITTNISSRFDPSNISEGSPDSQYTSYTVNKGEKMVFCIREKESKKLHDLNLLMYVSLHELAHVGCKSIGHNEEFKRNFKFLLEVAKKIGIYKPISFTNNTVKYCGLTL